ncbi:MAG: PEGA domain-containing protein [Kiritimatiellae bacterium]|nr:PEGA domain-containing protein [Kiritimatiellia bacterium]
MKGKFFAIVTAAAAALSQTALADDGGASAGGEPVKALLVVQNHVSDDFRKPLADLGDRVSAALSGDVFNVIDPNDAVGENLNRAPWGEDLPPTSATRLAQNLDAKVLITASVGEASVTGIGNPMVAQTVRMTLTLSAKRVPSGAGFAAVTVSEKSPNLTPEVLAQSTESVYSELVDRLVAKASAQFLAKAAKTAGKTDAPGGLTVFFGCNVLGADVQIDGLSYGTCPGQFTVSPGVHSVLVSYPPYYNDFRRQANFSQDGQTFAVVLQINPAGEQHRARMLEYDVKFAELDAQKRKNALELEEWRRQMEQDLKKQEHDDEVDYEKKKGELAITLDRKRRELDFEFEKKRKNLERELAEGSELFKKQLDLADAMLERYALSGEADDYVRKTIADGTSIYWQNSYGRIAITDGEAGNIEFATPAADTSDISVPPNPKEIGEGLQKLLMKRVGK